MPHTQAVEADTSCLAYVLSLAVPGLMLFSAICGQGSEWTNVAAFLPLVVAFAIVPVLSLLFDTEAVRTPSRSASHISRWFLEALPVIAAPAQFAAIGVAVAHWKDPFLGYVGSTGWLLSTGLLSAMFTVPVAHELIHRRSQFSPLLGGVLLSTACLGVFKIVHIRLHHRYVGTDRDFTSARRGESLYSFLPRALIGNSREAVRLEKVRLCRMNRSLWRSELTVWYGLSVLWFMLAAVLIDWTSGVFFLLQGLVATLILDWTNYVQHYGLRRSADATGRYEPVQSHHAWTIDCRISNLALFNLLRHGDHHARPLVPYHHLSFTTVPRYPYPFGLVLLLALVPPLFRRITHPRLDRLAVGGD